MDTFNNLLELQKELLQAQLKTIYRYQQKIPLKDKQLKRTSKLDIVEDILLSVDQPLHISKIIKIAQDDYHVSMERDSIVSALTKKIKAGIRFEKVAPNTFALKKDRQQ